MRPRLQKMKRNYVHMKHVFLSRDFPWGEMNKHLPTSVRVWEHRWRKGNCVTEGPPRRERELSIAAPPKLHACQQPSQQSGLPLALQVLTASKRESFQFFFIINSQTVRQLWKSSHSAHTGHTTFLELKHTTTSWRMDLSVTIRSCQSLQKSFQPAAGQS